MSFNEVKVSGGLTRDPEFKFLPNTGTAVMNATLAVNGARYDGKAGTQVVTTVYVSVEAYGSVAEDLMDEEISRGDELLVLGELSQYERELADGKKDRKTRVTATMVWVTRRRGGARARSQETRDWSADEVPPANEPPEDPWGDWDKKESK